jgi:hypothetical protein
VGVFRAHYSILMKSRSVALNCYQMLHEIVPALLSLEAVG